MAIPAERGYGMIGARESAFDMADVFVSYTRDDRNIARQFATELEREGFSVWWDQAIHAGEAFDRTTEHALANARAVVVLWSKRSVESDWVRAEATEAKATGRLVPVMIEPCKRPVIFELIHTADLAGWSGDATDTRWRIFIDGLRRTTGQTREVPRPEPQGPVAATAGRRGVRPGVALGIAAGLLAVAWLAYWTQFPRSGNLTPTAATDSPPAVPVTQTGVTLAVLPFANLSADPAQEYFSDGLTEEILNQLARIPALRLTGRTSSFSFKGKNEDLRQIGAKLGVANLLEGSVRKDGDRLRVTAQLIRAGDGTQQWSKSYDRSLSGLFAVQDEIAKDVAQALSVKLDVGTLNRAQGGTTNVEAYDGYLQWRQFALSERRDPEETRRMVQQLREAVALDPEFVLAWDGLAEALTRLAARVQPAEAGQLMTEAEAARARVAALAPDSWIVQRERAYALFAEGKHAEGIAVAKAMMESSPRSWEHTFPYTNLIFAVGRLEETFRISDELQAMEPLAMFMSRDQQWIHTSLRRYEDAEAEYQHSRALAGSRWGPEYVRLLRLLSRADTDPQTLHDQFRRARDSYEGKLPPYFLELEPVLGNRPRMLEILRREFAARPRPEMMRLADALGDAELALAVLRAFWNERSGYNKYEYLWTSPYSALRTLPGFKAHMIETGLADYWRQTGEWGDVCRPVGDDDFECS
jgi:TolB-like protein/tetratricopeptide (TPR) repeat protein